MLVVTSASLPLALACTCGSDPTPTTQRCTLGSDTPRVSSVELLTGAGAPLADGSALPEVFGGQGGTHWSFSLAIEGMGLGGCAEVLVQARVDGALVQSYDGTVTMRGTDRSARTTEIVIFGPQSIGIGRCVEVTASAFGQGAVTRRLAQWDPAACNRPPDAGMPDAGPPPECGNGRVEAAEECDEPDPARCTPHCERPRCSDGIASPAEACFAPTAARVLPPERISRLAYLGEASRLEIAGVGARWLVRYTASLLEPIGEPIPLAAPARALVAGDLDGDGARDDLAIADAASLHVLLGDAGVLAAPVTTALASPPATLLATQLDADDADELVLALEGGDVHVLDATAIDLATPVLDGIPELVSVTAFRSATGFDVLAVAHGSEVTLHTRSGSDPFAMAETFPRTGGSLLFAIDAGTTSTLLLEAGEDGLVVRERTGSGWSATDAGAFGAVTGLSVVPRDGGSVLLAASPYVTRAFAISPIAPHLPYWTAIDGGAPTDAVLGLPDGIIAVSRRDGLSLLVPSD